MAARKGYDHHHETSSGKPIETKRDYRSAPSAANKDHVEHITAVKRPGHGTKGDPINLLVNWFRINFNRTNIYVYKICVTEQGRGKKKSAIVTHSGTKSTMFWRAVRHYDKRSRLVFDDNEYLYTPDFQGERSSLSCYDPEEEEVRLPQGSNTPKGPRKHRVEFRVDFVHQKIMDFELDLRGDINSNPYFSSSSEYLKLLISQNTRYKPPKIAKGREKEVSERFTHMNGGMFIIPRPDHPLVYRIDIQPGVQSWLGLFASVRRMQNFSPVIHFGLVHKLFFKLNVDIITLYGLIENERDLFTGLPVADSARMCMSTENIAKFNNRLKDVKLRCSHVYVIDKDGFVTKPPVERHYRFVELVEGTRAALHELKVEEKPVSFNASGGAPRRWKKRTLYEWYGVHNIKLNYPNLPLCRVKTGKKEDLLPMELLFTHDQPQKFIKMLSFYARMQITAKLAKTPVQHHKLTNELISKSLEYDKDPFMKAMNISLDPKMIECEGRVVEPCAILAKSQSGDAEITLELKKETGEFSISRAIEISSKKIRFVVYKLTDAVSVPEIQEFHRQLVRKCVNRGFDIPESDHKRPWKWANETIETIRADPDTIAKLIEIHKASFHHSAKSEDEILVFLFFTKMFDGLYGQIKYLCDIQYGVVSQVVDAQTLKKAVSRSEGEVPSDHKSVYHHICLKLNAKLGGVNHILASPAKEPDEPDYGRMPNNERTMFIGIDVIHPSPNSPIRDCSLAAIVASMDQNAAKYAVRIKVNEKCNESVQHFDEHFAALLQMYHAESFNYDRKGYLPERIVILRDGVSDSEMVKAASEEINSIKCAWDKSARAANNQDCPPITYIIVQKNHKTRFYRRPDRADGKVENPPLGTVVDKGAVTPHMFDFYMVSHTTQLGTTRPIHYTVVYDDCQSSADSIQEMLFRMCYLYARCTKPVSLPAPVYYAHLACERAAFQHEYAIKKGEYDEILDIDPDKESQGDYSDRVQLEIQAIEKKLQVSNHPGMYFI